MVARGAASHGELDLSNGGGGGGDLLEAVGHGGTWSGEGLDGDRPKGGKGQVGEGTGCRAVLGESVG
jgi:hypothetical protein